MRHFLCEQLGPATLPRRVFARSLRRTLVFGARAAERLAPADRTALSGAVGLAVVAVPTYARLPIASSATELTNAIDHRDPGRRRFLDTGAETSDGPPRNVASITAMTRKARG
jgi:hypothetical protein